MMTTHTSANLHQQVIKLVMDQVDVAEEQITLDSDFSTELGFDSLTLIEFVMSIEEQFGISVPDDEAEQIKTVRQAIDKIELALAKQAA